MDLQPHHTLLTTALLMSAVAAGWDLKTGLIPNRVVLIGFGVAVVARLAIASITGEGPLMFLQTLGAGLAGALVVSLSTFLLYRQGGIGGGDVKLLAAVGFALGPMAGLEAELYAFMAGGLVACARLIMRGTLLRSLAGSASLLVSARTGELTSANSFRFGPAIFLGTLTASVLHWGVP